MQEEARLVGQLDTQVRVRLLSKFVPLAPGQLPDEDYLRSLDEAELKPKLGAHRQRVLLCSVC